MMVLVSGHSVRGSGTSVTINQLWQEGGQYITQLWIKTIQVEYLAEDNSKFK
jgi:hypothetical protein